MAAGVNGVGQSRQALGGIHAESAEEGQESLLSFIRMAQENYAKSAKKTEESFWERRIKSHKESMETAEEEAEKSFLCRERKMQAEKLDLEDRKDGYLSGVPAAELLSMLM